MPEVVPSRFIEMRERAGLSQSELARRAGVGQSSIQRIEAGETRNPRNLLLLARILGTTAEHLLGEIDVAAPGALADRQFAWRGRPSDDDDDRVEIASVDLSYGMGGAFLESSDPDVERVPFSRAWLRANVTTAPPEVLGVAQGIGDSMEPVLFDRDLVFFDRSARLEDHVSDKTWVFAWGQVGMIKRLRPMPDGTVKIMSANRTYPDEIASDGEMHIIGRVVASLRRL